MKTSAINDNYNTKVIQKNDMEFLFKVFKSIYLKGTAVMSY